jgi:hypothetical protein
MSKLRKFKKAQPRLRKRQIQHDEIVKQRQDKGRGYTKPGSLNAKRG